MTSQLGARLRSPETMRFVKFAAVGGSGVVVNMGVLWLGKNYVFASLAHASAVAWAGALAIAVSIVSNFVLNDGWTWRDREKRGTAHFFERLGKYVAVASVAGVVQWLVLQGGVWLGLHYLLANFVGIGAGIVINYFLNNYWTFRAKR